MSNENLPKELREHGIHAEDYHGDSSGIETRIICELAADEILSLRKQLETLKAVNKQEGGLKMNTTVIDLYDQMDDMKRARLMMRSKHPLSLDELDFVHKTLGRSPHSDDQTLAGEARRMMDELAVKEINHESSRTAEEGSVFLGIINAFLIVAVMMAVWSVAVSVRNFWAVTEDAAMGAQ